MFLLLLLYDLAALPPRQNHLAPLSHHERYSLNIPMFLLCINFQCTKCVEFFQAPFNREKKKSK